MSAYYYDLAIVMALMMAALLILFVLSYWQQFRIEALEKTVHTLRTTIQDQQPLKQ